MADWFALNAPQPEGDWFAQNVPSMPTPDPRQNAQISALPKPSIWAKPGQSQWDWLKETAGNVVHGNVFSEQTPVIGRLLEPKPSDPTLAAVAKDAGRPITQTQIIAPDAMTPERGPARAVAQAIGGLTTPENVALLLSLGKLGKMGKVGQSAARSASAAFAAGMGEAALSGDPEWAEAKATGDKSVMAEIITRKAIEGIFSLLAGKHAVGGRPATPTTTGQPNILNRRMERARPITNEFGTRMEEPTAPPERTVPPPPQKTWQEAQRERRSTPNIPLERVIEATQPPIPDPYPGFVEWAGKQTVFGRKKVADTFKVSLNEAQAMAERAVQEGRLSARKPAPNGAPQWGRVKPAAKAEPPAPEPVPEPAKPPVEIQSPEPVESVTGASTQPGERFSVEKIGEYEALGMNADGKKMRYRFTNLKGNTTEHEMPLSDWIRTKDKGIVPVRQVPEPATLRTESVPAPSEPVQAGRELTTEPVQRVDKATTVGLQSADVPKPKVQETQAPLSEKSITISDSVQEPPVSTVREQVSPEPPVSAVGEKPSVAEPVAKGSAEIVSRERQVFPPENLTPPPATPKETVGIAPDRQGGTGAAPSGFLSSESGQIDYSRLRNLAGDESGDRATPYLRPNVPPEEESLNFKRIRVSPGEEAHLREQVRIAQEEQKILPKSVESYASVQELAKTVTEDAIDKVLGQPKASPEDRAAVLAVRSRILALNEESLKLHEQLSKADSEAMVASEKAKLDERVEKIDADLREYVGSFAKLRTMSGRNLSALRITAELTDDPAIWLVRARRAAGLSPEQHLPEPTSLRIRQLAQEARTARTTIDESVPPELRTEETQAKQATSRAETAVAQAQKVLREAQATEKKMADTAAKGEALEQKAEEVKSQTARAKAALDSSRAELNKARGSYQRLVARRERLLSENPRVKDATENLRRARAQLVTEVAKLEETGWWDMGMALWRAGLLTGFKTHARNIMGNFAFQGTEELSRIPATLVDMAMGMASGRRTIAGIDIAAVYKASYGAATKGVSEALNILKRGATVDEMAKLDAHREVNFQKLGKYSDYLNKYVNGVFRMMAAEDRIFKSYALERSIQAQARLKAINERKAGIISREEVAKRSKWLSEHPTEDMAVQAVADAEFATFNNRNSMADMVMRGKSALSDPGRAAATAALPFVRTPFNISARLMEYTGLGGIYNSARALHAAKNASGRFLTPESQRVFANSIGRGATGWALLYLGYHLAAANLATGTGQQETSKRAVEEASGRKPGSIRVGDDWLTVLGLSPIGNLLIIGATYYRERTNPLKDESRRPGRLAAVAGRTILEQPYFTGLQDVIESLTNPERSGARVASSYVGSLIPTLVGDLSTLANPKRADTNARNTAEVLLNPLAAKTPFRSKLPERTDILGEPLEGRRQSALNPFLPSTAKEAQDPMLSELVRLRVGIGKPDKRDGESDEELKLREQLTGRVMAQGLRDLMQSDAGNGKTWLTLPRNQKNDDLRREDIQDVLRDARREVRELTDYMVDKQIQPGERLKMYRRAYESMAPAKQ